MPKKNGAPKKAHVIAVDMGYGHQRAAYPLKCLAYKGQIVNANNYKGIPKEDRDIWKNSRKAYEFISRFKKVPILGEFAWDIYDKLQEIPKFYPKRDLTAPTIQLKSIYSIIEKKDWGKHLIETLGKNPIPIITTFFITAFMAEIHGYPGEIYCLATDTDISRAWVAKDPRSSRIKYFAPNPRVHKRLRMYGVRSENIFTTGFPLPDELVGGPSEKILKKELAYRLSTLDPKRVYINSFKETVKTHLGIKTFPKRNNHILTLMFAVGGAGAQRELGKEIMLSLKEKIRSKSIRIVLVAGVHNDVNNYFKAAAKDIGLVDELGKGVVVIYGKSKDDYFKKFNKMLSHTDILWTKPSELSFYAALGLPIIMADPIGSQELFNRRWLRTIGAGINQENPKYTSQWLFDWLESGWFAEAAMNGFLDASTSGVENIRKVLAHKPEETTEITKVLHY